MNWGALFGNFMVFLLGAGVVLLLLPPVVRSVLSGSATVGAAGAAGRPAGGGSQPPAAEAAQAVPFTPSPGSGATFPMPAPISYQGGRGIGISRDDWEAWRIRPTWPFQAPLSPNVLIDSSVVLGGPWARAPLRLSHPWLITLLDPSAPEPVWQQVAQAAVQTGTAVLCPYAVATTPAPYGLGLIVAPSDFDQVASHPEDPRLQQAGLVVLDLRDGLPNWGRWAAGRARGGTDVARLRPAAEDGSPIVRKACRRLHEWAMGAPVLLGVGAGPHLPRIWAALAELGCDGLLVWGAPWAGSSPQVGWPAAGGLAALLGQPGGVIPQTGGRSPAKSSSDPYVLVGAEFPEAGQMVKALALGARALVWGVDSFVTNLAAGSQATDLVTELSQRWQQVEDICRGLGCRKADQLGPGHLIASTPAPPAIRSTALTLATPVVAEPPAPSFLGQPSHLLGEGSPAKASLSSSQLAMPEGDSDLAASGPLPAPSTRASRPLLPQRLRPRPLHPRPLVPLAGVPLLQQPPRPRHDQAALSPPVAAGTVASGQSRHQPQAPGR
ncbi:MAG: hypothetical protein IMX01_01620 [Limnochordaceae bacterium]|nr:hypothetical protein [Limnochordaceae bacterium]